MNLQSSSEINRQPPALRVRGRLKEHRPLARGSSKCHQWATHRHDLCRQSGDSIFRAAARRRKRQRTSRGHSISRCACGPRTCTRGSSTGTNPTTASKRQRAPSRTPRHRHRVTEARSAAQPRAPRASPHPKSVHHITSNLRELSVQNPCRARFNFRALHSTIDYSMQRTRGIVMPDFDYLASAELFAPQGRSGLRYRRFPRAADAIRYAIEKLPADRLSGSRLEIEGRRYDSQQIRALYENEAYPLTRTLASSRS
jgi:hypothetical protein